MGVVVEKRDQVADVALTHRLGDVAVAQHSCDDLERILADLSRESRGNRQARCHRATFVDRPASLWVKSSQFKSSVECHFHSNRFEFLNWTCIPSRLCVRHHGCQDVAGALHDDLVL